MFSNIQGSFINELLCSLSEPVLVIDEELKIFWTNPSAEMFFGHSTEYMSGQECRKFLACSDEFIENCPVKRSLATGEGELLVVDGLLYPDKLLEAIPYSQGNKNYTLAIVHSVPEIDRDKALRRDFAARLNQHSTLEEAASDIIMAMQSLSFLPSCGIYVRKRGRFELLEGQNVPAEFCNVPTVLDFSKPQYLSSERLPFETDISFPEGGAIIPVISPDGSSNVLLFAGRGSMCTKSRNRLEMMADVLGTCISRLM